MQFIVSVLLILIVQATAQAYTKIRSVNINNKNVFDKRSRISPLVFSGENGNFYFGGGMYPNDFGDDGRIPLQDFYMLDIKSKSVTRLPDLPVGFFHGQGIQQGNYIFVNGMSRDNVFSSHLYDMTTQQWTSPKDLQGSFHHFSINSKGEIWAISSNKDLYPTVSRIDLQTLTQKSIFFAKEKDLRIEPRLALLDSRDRLIFAIFPSSKMGCYDTKKRTVCNIPDRLSYRGLGCLAETDAGYFLLGGGWNRHDLSTYDFLKKNGGSWVNAPAPIITWNNSCLGTFEEIIFNSTYDIEEKYNGNNILIFNPREDQIRVAFKNLSQFGNSNASYDTGTTLVRSGKYIITVGGKTAGGWVGENSLLALFYIK